MQAAENSPTNAPANDNLNIGLEVTHWGNLLIREGYFSNAFSRAGLKVLH